MTIQEVIKRSIPYAKRKYENMTVLQRLRCDLLNEAADYDHTHMHERNPKKADKLVADELVEIAQNYAWRYSKHKQIQLLDRLTSIAGDARILEKATVMKILEIEKLTLQGELLEYQQQFKNMELM